MAVAVFGEYAAEFSGEYLWLFMAGGMSALLLLKLAAGFGGPALLVLYYGWRTGSLPLRDRALRPLLFNALIAFGVLGTLFTVPIMTGISQTTNVWTAFFLIMAALVIVSGYTSINAVVKAELFPAEVRALGVGLPYALTVSIFGGTAEYIALWLKQAGHESLFYWYVTGTIFLSLLVYVFMRDTRKHSRIEH